MRAGSRMTWRRRDDEGPGFVVGVSRREGGVLGGVKRVLAAFWQREFGGKSGAAKSAVARFPEVKPRKPQVAGFWDGLWLLSRHQGGGESKGEEREGQRKPRWPKSGRKRGGGC